MMGQATRQDDSLTRQKLLAVTLTALMVFSMFSGTVFFASTPATAAANDNTQTSPRFEITSVGNAGGDLSVTVEATTTPVKNSRFWYDDLAGTSAGPTPLGAGEMLGAFYNDSAASPPAATRPQR